MPIFQGSLMKVREADGNVSPKSGVVDITYHNLLNGAGSRQIKASGAILLHRGSIVTYRKISSLYLKTVRKTVRKILRTMSRPSSLGPLTGGRYNLCQP